MKRILNVAAFIIIIGLVGAWECGNADFKTLLLQTGTVLCSLLFLHFLRFLCLSLTRIKKHRTVQRPM